MTSYHNPARRAAFTLIELLVVIAIIALLIGILLPALGSARDSARQLKCLTQVRAMGQGFTFYADDNRDWYPIIPTNPTQYPNDGVLDGQHTAGGVAGLFSLFQVGDGEAIRPDGNGGGGSASGDTGYLGLFGSIGTYYGGEDTPLMSGYLSGLEILTCPSDKLDYYWRPYPTDSRNKIAQADNQKTPEPPATEEDVIHYNISYLYIAGLKTIDPTIQFAPPLWGDETNTGDVKFNAWYGWDWRENRPGSAGEPDPVNDFGFNPKTGYAKDDNHGDKGGNFVRADGSASFVTTNPQAIFFMSAEDIADEELRSSSLSINLIRKDRSNRVQVID